jgi:hypothetical protein
MSSCCRTGNRLSPRGGTCWKQQSRCAQAQRLVAGWGNLHPVVAQTAIFARLGTRSVAESLGIKGQTLTGQQLIDAVQRAQGYLPSFQRQFVNNDLQIIRGALELQQYGPLPPSLAARLPESESVLNIWLQNIQF